MARKILVIGGNRFFGRRLVQLLIDNNDDVTVLNRGQSADGFGDGIQRLVCDRRDTAKVRSLVQNREWDIVYDQVCFDADEAEAACSIFDTQARRYIFTSSQFVYPVGRNLNETAFLPLEHRFSKKVKKDVDYAEAKRQCEHVFVENLRGRVCAVRLPIVVGPDDYTERLKFHIQRIQNHKPIALPKLDVAISLISSADAAAGLFYLGNIDASGPINIAAPAPIEVGMILKEIESITGKTALLNDRGDVSPYGFQNDWYMDVSFAAKIGFTATPIESWLPTTIQKIISTL